MRGRGYTFRDTLSLLVLERKMICIMAFCVRMLLLYHLNHHFGPAMCASDHSDLLSTAATARWINDGVFRSLEMHKILQVMIVARHSFSDCWHDWVRQIVISD